MVLARRLAEEGQYPAIDIEASISRAMPQVVEELHLQKAQVLKRLYARYQQSRDLISVGAYVKGSDPETDLAISKISAIRSYLAQGMNERVDFNQSLKQLDKLFNKE